MSIELTEGQIIAKTLQEIKDTLNGGITHRNMKSIRTFFVVSGQDSLDSDYPMYLPFNIPLTTQTVVSVYVSFWLLPFRAYSKATQNNAQQTSSSGGGTTTSSGGGTEVTSASGGSISVTSGSGGGGTVTSQSVAGNHHHTIAINTGSSGNAVTFSGGALYSSSGGTTDTGGPSSSHAHTVTIANHTHSVTASAHTHTVTISAHTHTVGDHTHTVDGHTHDITFGIYEENNSPSVTLFVSRDAGATYPYEIGTYSANQYSLDITSFVDTPGSKMLKFESTALGRLSVQIEITLDVSR